MRFFHLTQNVGYKHTTWIPRRNDVETTVSTWFQRGIHVVCLQGGRSENLQTNTSRLSFSIHHVRLLLIAIHPCLEMLDACAIITALMKRLKNNFQLNVGRWKFNFRPNQHLSNKDIKQKNSQRFVLIRYWRVKKKVIVRDYFKTALSGCIVPIVTIPCFFWRPFTLLRYQPV